MRPAIQCLLIGGLAVGLILAVANTSAAAYPQSSAGVQLYGFWDSHYEGLPGSYGGSGAGYRCYQPGYSGNSSWSYSPSGRVYRSPYVYYGYNRNGRVAVVPGRATY